jgi:hypothetical protein
LSGVSKDYLHVGIVKWLPPAKQDFVCILRERLCLSSIGYIKPFRSIFVLLLVEAEDRRR